MDTQENKTELNKQPLKGPDTVPKQKTSRRKKIIIVSILALLLIAVGTFFAITYLQPKISPSGSNFEQPGGQQTAPLSDLIYFYANKELLAIAPESKKITLIDTGIATEINHSDYGYTTPLNAPNFHMAAYVKDNSGWIAIGTEKSKFFAIPEDKEKTGYYTIYVSAWSPDSSMLAFSVGFMCPIMGSTCTPNDEDKNVSGLYSYNVQSKTVKKLAAPSIIQWIPQTKKIAYFDNTTEPTKLFTINVTDGAIATLSTQQFGFGPQTAFSDNGQKAIYAAGIDGTKSSQIFSSNLDGSARETLKSGAFADFQWPKFLPNSTTNFAYSKRVNITCYNGSSGCVNHSLQVVKDGVEKTATDLIDDKMAGFYKNSIVVIAGDGQNGIDPNNPAPYNSRIEFIDLDTFEKTILYEMTSSKTVDSDLRLRLRIGS